MGLDMYLDRFPRYKHYTANDMEAVDDYMEWMNRGEKYKDSSFEQWCGRKEEDLPRKEDMDKMMSLAKLCTYAWDKERRYERVKLNEGVAYWRKANAVHKWFVENVQDGEDDCEYHREVTQDDLEQLRDICKKIMDECVLVKGKAKNGYTWDGKKEVPNYQEGLIIVNPEICKKMLPTKDGFFFGGTEYDEWYMDDVRSTYEQIEKILKETDFEKQMIYYRSSW